MLIIQDIKHFHFNFISHHFRNNNLYEVIIKLKQVKTAILNFQAYKYKFSKRISYECFWNRASHFFNDFKVELFKDSSSALEDKYKKAMVQNATLDNEKTTINYEVRVRFILFILTQN